MFARGGARRLLRKVTTMFFHQRFIPGLAIASYMVGDEKAKQVAVIDPTRDVDEYVRIARAEGLHITHVLETHVHADFVSGSAELKARLGGEPKVVVSGMGGREWTPPYADVVVKDGDEVKLGAVRLRAMHTPGHTPEHLTWALYDDTRSADTPWLLFTGDFVFVGDVGRPDLLGPEQRKELAHQLYHSLFDVLPALPDFTEVFPGHGAGSLCGKAIGSRRSSTLGFERRFNHSLQKADEAQWTNTLLKDMPLAPPYFRRMKEVNARGPEILGSELPGQRRISAAEIHRRLCPQCMVVDVRPKEAFAAAHIPGAINIPLGQNLPTWAGWVLPYDKRLVIVPEDANDMPEVVTHLIRVGLDEIQGYMEDGMDAWENQGFEIAHLETMSVQELDSRLRQSANGRPFVLDVRTETEWKGGHIDGALHVHGGVLKDRYQEVPKDRPVAVICGTGYRGSIAASFLQSLGYTQVSNVLGGMSAWKAAGLPTVN
jgi:hydroxyacylglutathione hydrolase